MKILTRTISTMRMGRSLRAELGLLLFVASAATCSRYLECVD